MSGDQGPMGSLVVDLLCIVAPMYGLVFGPCFVMQWSVPFLEYYIHLT